MGWLTIAAPRISFASRIAGSRWRIVLALSASVLGFALGTFANEGEGRLGIALLALPLALPVAVAKTATACGMNALGTFSVRRRALRSRLISALVYLFVGTAAAAGVGWILSSAGGALGFDRLLPLAAPVCAYLGLREFGLLGRRPLVSSSWQVPARWVKRARVAPLVWGVFLGSGVATQMPYPSFYALLLLAAMLPTPIAAGLMAAYGLARTMPAVAAALWERCSATPSVSRLFGLRLVGHFASGIGCLMLAGSLLTLVV